MRDVTWADLPYVIPDVYDLPEICDSERDALAEFDANRSKGETQ